MLRREAENGKATASGQGGPAATLGTWAQRTRAGPPLDQSAEAGWVAQPRLSAKKGGTTAGWSGQITSVATEKRQKNKMKKKGKGPGTAPNQDQPAADAVAPRQHQAWACGICTYVHSVSTAFGYLSCEVCGAERSDQDNELVTTAGTTASAAGALDHSSPELLELDASLDADVVFVAECCGPSVPLEAIRCAVEAAGGQVDVAIESLLLMDSDAELARRLQEAENEAAHLLMDSDVELARRLHEAENEAAQAALTAEERDRLLAEKIAAADERGPRRSGRKPKPTALWSGGNVLRRRCVPASQWQPRVEPRHDDAVPTREQLQETFATEFGLLDENEDPEVLRLQHRRIKQRQIVAAKRASAAYRLKSPLASAHSEEAGGLGSEYDVMTTAVIAATLCHHNTVIEIADRLALHGLFVTEALDVVERYFEIHHNAVAKWGRRYPIRTVMCVTGRGKNSNGGARLRPALMSWLNAHSIRYSESGEGSLEISVFGQRVL
jgi:hypothetical protein